MRIPQNTISNPIAARHPFRIEAPKAWRWERHLPRAIFPTIERILGIDQINALYARILAGGQKLDQFLDSALNEMEILYRVSSADLDSIPKSGPVIVTANHPFGGIEGIVLAHLLRKVRPDVKMLANFMLGKIVELRELFFLVDPFATEASIERNVGPTRQAMRWLRNGGILAMFPAGEVSHLRIGERGISDPRWEISAARIARSQNVPVLPIYIDGCNSVPFQLAGLLHPRLRTAMLARELLNKQGSQIELRIGSLIQPKNLQQFEDDAKATDYLRQRTYLLRHRATQPARKPATVMMNDAPIADRGDLPSMQREVDALPAEQVLLRHSNQVVFFARARQIPNLLNEIGRLREIAFRATGEGTGKPRDVDEFDQAYLHLVLWNSETSEVVGGYRLGLSDQLIERHGLAGLYTHTLFKFDGKLLRRIFPAIELGRSFVAPAHQKAFAPLMLLWKGIGAFLVRHPRYRYVFGPVSISDRYQSMSKQLMVRFLRVHHSAEQVSHLVRPRNPFQERSLGGWDDRAIRGLLSDTEGVSTLVSEIEPDRKSVPVLLRQYLKLGAKLLAVNVDPNFSDVVDGLLVTDLLQTDRRVLERYMGRDGLRSFLLHHLPTEKSR